MRPDCAIDLGEGVSFELWRVEGWVTTLYGAGAKCVAARADTPENRAAAAEQGYRGAHAVWDCLVEHELGHTLVARALLGAESCVLRFESGAEKNRYALRLHEEALVLSLQHYMNGGGIDPVLVPHAALLLKLEGEISRAVKACQEALRKARPQKN